MFVETTQSGKWALVLFKSFKFIHKKTQIVFQLTCRPHVVGPNCQREAMLQWRTSLQQRGWELTLGIFFWKDTVIKFCHYPSHWHLPDIRWQDISQHLNVLLQRQDEVGSHHIYSSHKHLLGILWHLHSCQILTDRILCSNKIPVETRNIFYDKKSQEFSPTLPFYCEICRCFICWKKSVQKVISDIQNDLSMKIKIFSLLKIELWDKIEEIHFEQDINFCKRQILLIDFPPVKIKMFLKIKQMKSSFIFCNKMMKMKWIFNWIWIYCGFISLIISVMYFRPRLESHSKFTTIPNNHRL